MSDPERLTNSEVPSCSIADCEAAGGAIVDGKLLCLKHATEELKKRRSNSSTSETREH
jgi:hypothetical protein